MGNQTYRTTHGTRNSPAVLVSNKTEKSFFQFGVNNTNENTFWKWGDDNLFPYALAALSRKSTTHRRIINDKADYISGKGISYDKTDTILSNMVDCANGDRESLRHVLNKIAFDKCLLGNAFVEIITDESHSFLSFYHQDASKCRLNKDKTHIILHHN